MLHDTPKIRTGSDTDFELLAGNRGLQLTDSIGLQARQIVRRWPKPRASVAAFKSEQV